MSINSKFVTLKNYIPIGIPKEEDFEIKEVKISISEQNEVLVNNLWLSVDPYMRARMTEKKNYKPPFKLGEPMEGSAIGQVIKSNSKILKRVILF